MITTCQKCGKKHRIDPEKIKGDSARFKCRSCGQVIKVYKPVEKPIPKPSPLPPQSKLRTKASEPVPKTPEPLKGKAKKKTPKAKLNIEGMSIRFKITMIIVALVTISLAIAGSIASLQSRNALSKQAEDHLVTNTQLKAKEYALTFKRIKEEVLGLADYASATYKREDIDTDIGMKTLMPWDGTGYGNTSLDAELHNERLFIQRIGLVLKSVVANNPYLSLGYLGTETEMTVFDNESVVGVIEKLKAFNVTQRPWYVSTKKKKKVIWTEPYVDANTKKLVVTCAAPVFNSKNVFVGAVGFDVLLDTLQKDILTMDIGYDSYAFLVSSKGSVLVRPGMKSGDARWDTTYKTSDLLKTDNTQFNSIISKMIKGKSGIDTYETGDEIRYTAYAPLQTIGASMGIVASKDEVVKPAVAIRNLIIIVFVVVLLLSILIGLFIGNNITKPINELTMMANLISQGKKDLNVLDEDRKDEIGVLTKAFNRLVISLKLAMSR
ncbi:MAG: zinc-ribbon domain-containing protein [Desulfobacteraceae bacterium]|nr:zinc-ribbon domain-containing protein [Desulfobacteraceae bacterium]